MATYPPQGVTLEAGWESQAHGPTPWLDTLDEAASYLEGTAFFVFWVDFGEVPAFASCGLDLQAYVDGFPVLRVSRTYEGTSSPTVGVSADVPIYDAGIADGTWGRASVPVGLAHEGGPLTLWFRTTSAGELWSLSLSYLALVPADEIPPRRIFPRDDGLAGGAPRTFPPSKGIQSSNRIVGGYL